ncbi:uncharacterized protein Tco025E_08487 [Trypanosoma conorhini]|uniref:Uncharacterized protein n=1 Tax=Trypanosoma conorhini TaxID=83891 RepID=A0A422N8Z6_9TRYP|nr:uncharacterized protein Tco025E_08487 [Trypanosoma conorhini]RNF01921.1 hypothetical protein Tco025E_08487 [Trypanosoma conorhini]
MVRGECHFIPCGSLFTHTCMDAGHGSSSCLPVVFGCRGAIDAGKEMEFLCREGPPRRFFCANKETYREVWPCTFSRRVPAARSFLRWSARNGAAVHCALKLQLHPGRGCRLVATRLIPAGQALISLPLTLSLSAAAHDERKSFSHRWDPLETLTGVVVRELHNPRGFHRRYLEFLHDLYNTETANMATDRIWLREELEMLYMGNSMQAQGILNGPFLSKESLVTASQRVEWVRLRSLLRRMEQSLPHFVSKSVPWGMSMVLSRALCDDYGGLTLYPIIDFCLHSFTPNSLLCVMPASSGRGNGVGLRWHSTDGPCAHLLTQRAIAAGESVTLLYSPRRVLSTEDAEYWKLRWGYVPN